MVDAAYMRARRWHVAGAAVGALAAGEDRELDGNMLATLFIAACV